MNDTQADELQGLRASYYVNLAAHEYINYGSIFKAIDPTHYSGYQEDMYVEEYYRMNPIKLVMPG